MSDRNTNIGVTFDIAVRQETDSPLRETIHSIQARRLPDGRVELWAVESNLDKYPGKGQTARWQKRSVIVTLDADNATRLARVFVPKKVARSRLVSPA